jgi:hypothetical protein
MMKVAECMEDDSMYKKNKYATSFTTHNKSEYWKCNIDYKWPKKGPKEEMG